MRFSFNYILKEGYYFYAKIQIYHYSYAGEK